LTNPAVLIIGSLALFTAEAAFQKSVHSKLSTYSSSSLAAVNIVSLLVGVIALVSLIAGVILGIKWLVNKDKRGTPQQ
jgi:uncharacterized membrane protein YdcZ (DUF606 family)